MRTAARIGVCILGGCLPAACTPSLHTVTYKATGDPDWPHGPTDAPMLADINVRNQDGGSEQHVVQLPYSENLTVPSGAFVYISVQAREGSEISCEIDEDGAVVKQSRSDGEYSIATCSGRA